MEGLDLNWFCRCSTCGRVLTGSLEVKTCDCPYYCCQVCMERQQPGQCPACGTQYRARQNLVQKITQLYKGVISFYSIDRSRPQGIQLQVQDLVQAVQDAARGPDVNQISPQAYEQAVQIVETPPVAMGAVAYSAEQPSTPTCSGCHVPLGTKGRCPNCRKVALDHVGFNHQAFLSNKWNCSQCSFRNVHSSNRCVNCSYVQS